MKLSEYLVSQDTGEVNVWDTDYDIEVYFNSGDIEPKTTWDKAMRELANILTVKEVTEYGVVVNFSEIIDSKISELNRMSSFRGCDTDYVMSCIEGILAGNADDAVFMEFVEIITE